MFIVVQHTTQHHPRKSYFWDQTQLLVRDGMPYVYTMLSITNDFHKLSEIYQKTSQLPLLFKVLTSHTVR